MPVCLPVSFGSVTLFGCRFDLICWLGCTLLTSIHLRFSCWFDLICIVGSVKLPILLCLLASFIWFRCLVWFPVWFYCDFLKNNFANLTLLSIHPCIIVIFFAHTQILIIVFLLNTLLSSHRSKISTVACVESIFPHCKVNYM